MKLEFLSLRYLALFVAAFAIVSCNCPKENKDNSSFVPALVAPTAAEETAEEIASKLDADGNYIYEIGSLMDFELPDGVTINAGDNSTEYKLYKQLSDGTFVVSDDKTQNWVTFDRVYFATGSANLTEASQKQVTNIIAILKAFPTAELKIGGYTDSTGSDEVNLQVSEERAKVVVDQIVAGGIDASRVSHEGYGAQHFVCPANDTDECKAQNRRVDLRVTKK